MTDRSRRQRIAIAVGGWIGAAVLATGVTLAVVSSIGTDIFGSSAGPLDRGDIAQQLSTPSPSDEPEPTPTRTPDPTSSPSTQSPAASPASEPTVLTSAGGSVVARCLGDQVELLSWSPAQGFRVDKAERGPAETVEVEFESGDDEVEMKIQCVDGKPTKVEVDD